MGVKDLWNILEPAAESCSLADLQGKCLAVDISTWIFQSKEALTGKEAIHPHLRFDLYPTHIMLSRFCFSGFAIQFMKC